MIRRESLSIMLQTLTYALLASSLLAVDPLAPAHRLSKRTEIAPGPFQPTEESLKQYQYPDWFRDAKLGIWAVWGPESVPEQGDWYARNLYLEGGGQANYHVQHYCSVRLVFWGSQIRAFSF
jgi:alpha-L-fucosidase